MSEQESGGAPLPPVVDRRFYRVISPVCSGPLIATLLGERYFGQWMHWDKVPLPCIDRRNCRHCKAGLPHRWTGFIACWSHNRQEPAILQLSEGAARQLLTPLTEKGSLRGLTVEIRRELTSKRNSAQVVKIVSVEKGKGLPADFDILDTLHRLWGVNEAYNDRWDRFEAEQNGKRKAWVMPEKISKEQLARVQAEELIPFGPDDRLDLSK